MVRNLRILRYHLLQQGGDLRVPQQLAFVCFGAWRTFVGREWFAAELGWGAREFATLRRVAAWATAHRAAEASAADGTDARAAPDADALADGPTRTDNKTHTSCGYTCISIRIFICCSTLAGTGPPSARAIPNAPAYLFIHCVRAY